MRRVLEFAYNPETGNWHLRAGDMSDDYIDYMQGAVEAEGFVPAEWSSIEKRMKKPSALWRSWDGNRMNFRKPGTKG